MAAISRTWPHPPTHSKMLYHSIPLVCISDSLYVRLRKNQLSKSVELFCTSLFVPSSRPTGGSHAEWMALPSIPDRASQRLVRTV